MLLLLKNVCAQFVYSFYSYKKLSKLKFHQEDIYTVIYELWHFLGLSPQITAVSK